MNVPIKVIVVLTVMSPMVWSRFLQPGWPAFIDEAQDHPEAHGPVEDSRLRSNERPADYALDDESASRGREHGEDLRSSEQLEDENPFGGDDLFIRGGSYEKLRSNEQEDVDENPFVDYRRPAHETNSPSTIRDGKVVKGLPFKELLRPSFGKGEAHQERENPFQEHIRPFGGNHFEPTSLAKERERGNLVREEKRYSSFTGRDYEPKGDPSSYSGFFVGYNPKPIQLSLDSSIESSFHFPEFPRLSFPFDGPFRPSH